MKCFLMFKDHDFDMHQELPSNEQDLVQDLELSTLFNAMAKGDAFLLDVARKAVLTGLTNDKDTILYRQNIFKDCLENSSLVRAIYDVAVESIEREKKVYFGLLSKYPETILHRSVQVLHIFVEMLKKLRSISDKHADKFQSKGFIRFFSMISKELDDDYFASIELHLGQLNFRNGLLISAELGSGNKGAHYTMRKPNSKNGNWMKRIFSKKNPVYSYTLADRDDAGAKALSELRDRGLNCAAKVLAQSADHILSFFTMLRYELAFYIGSLNVHEQLASIGGASTIPVPVVSGNNVYSSRGLYDVCLALTMKQRITSNELDTDNKNLILVTGANQGGKSTFLRSIGLSQLMMQCGMFVPAEFFCSDLYDRIFTHYRREEDASMISGKLDEELQRMDDIVNSLTPHSMVLFNESFAATNEREGSEIARQITGALYEAGIKIFFVTHLYDFARGLYESKTGNMLFMRAERHPDGSRTFKIVEGEPLQTSYAEDLYKKTPLQQEYG